MSGVVTKAIAEITPGADDASSDTGVFDVVLSAETEDRDGDTLLRDEWKTPLPDHITFDTDHGMSVATTIGSGVPTIADDGTLRVSGSYSSIPRGQEIRTLVNEGHIRTVSVAFLTEKTAKGATTKTTRELLNGAFVAIPSNREAVVLSSKGFDAMVAETKAAQVVDTKALQTVHDSLVAAGAECGAVAATKNVAAPRRAGVKSIVGSVEALQDRICEALEAAYGAQWGYWGWLRGCLPNADNTGGTVVFQSSKLGDPDVYDSCTYSQTYTDDGEMVTLTGEATEVDIHEIVVPDADADRKSLTVSDPAALPAAGSDTTSDDDEQVLLRGRAASIRALAALQ